MGPSLQAKMLAYGAVREQSLFAALAAFAEK